MLLTTLTATLLVATGAQTFSFGTAAAESAIPSFDSQRSTSLSTTSSIRENPFGSFSAIPNTRSRGSTIVSFEDFFSSSKVSTPKKTSTTRGNSRSNSDQSAAQQPSRNRPPISPNPTITSRGATFEAVRESTLPPVRRVITPVPVTQIEPRKTQILTSNRNSVPSPSEDVNAVRSTPDLSSRGRVQEEPVKQPVTRPPTTTETNEVPDVRENLVGHSICARGKIGDACRRHLATTAMACTSGFCQECQQCDTMTPDHWPKCCREHYLCCRPLGRACQECDLPVLKPFCGAAFGRCN